MAISTQAEIKGLKVVCISARDVRNRQPFWLSSRIQSPMEKDGPSFGNNKIIGDLSRNKILDKRIQDKHLL